MKRWRVLVELDAQQDIADAHLWLAERDSDAADAWFDSVYDTIGSLEIFPERCPIAPESKFLDLENSPDLPWTTTAQMSNSIRSNGIRSSRSACPPRSAFGSRRTSARRMNIYEPTR